MSERRSDPTCQEVVELVTDYLEGAMPSERIDQFEQHIVFCQGCDAYLEQMRRSIALTRSVGDVDVDPMALEQLMAAFRGWRE
jgi:Putative zinc-finger